MCCIVCSLLLCSWCGYLMVGVIGGSLMNVVLICVLLMRMVRLILILLMWCCCLVFCVCWVNCCYVFSSWLG